MRVLLAEDDCRVSSFVQRGLAQEGFCVDVSADGRDAFNQAIHHPYDLIVLDVMMPFLNGFEVLSELRRQKCGTPVLFLSARDGVEDRVWALNHGADDYLVKPFALDELVARLRALLRRPSGGDSPVIRIGDLEMDFGARQVMRNGKPIKLTPKEFSLLEYLVRHKRIVVTRTMISEHVWDRHFDSFSNVVDVYIRYLRTKVDKDFPKKLIHTVRGVGYVLSEQAP